MTYKTYQEWLDDGMVVNKGEKSHKRSPEGSALFSQYQVVSNRAPAGEGYDPEPNDALEEMARDIALE